MAAAILAKHHVCSFMLTPYWIPRQYGFGEIQRFSQELVPDLEQKGHRVHFGTMLFPHWEALWNEHTERHRCYSAHILPENEGLC